MSAGPPRPVPEFDPDASGPMDRVAALLRAYTRAFLSQGVGLVGLVWCLAQNLPWIALGLAVLVLADQAVFLRGRAPLPQLRALQRGLDLWCLAVSAADLMILFAAAFRATGLREAGGGPVSDPLDCLAFAVATLARLDLGLVPLGSAGRLVAAGEALFGDVLLLWALAALLRAALRAGALRQP